MDRYIGTICIARRLAIRWALLFLPLFSAISLYACGPGGEPSTVPIEHNLTISEAASAPIPNTATEMSEGTSLPSTPDIVHTGGEL